MLLLEHVEAKQNLAHLQTKATQLAESLGMVRDWLATAAKEHTAYDRTRIQMLDANIRTGAEKYSEALNFDSILALVDEIGQADVRVRELAQSKEKLGLQ
jgi:hypothetical protein